MSFGRLRQRIVLKCVPHGQHDYFSLFIQSDHCFQALSLPLFFLKLSTYTTLRLRNFEAKAGYQDRKEDLPVMTTHYFIYSTKSKI